MCSLDFARQLERELAESKRDAWRRLENANSQQRVAIKMQDRAEQAEAALAEAKREIDYLRRYGNKDCTAMADAAMRKEK
jgi:hypothetical protein